MSLYQRKTQSWTTLPTGIVVFLALALTGCGTIEREFREERYEEASQACSDYGARAGSRAYEDCMRRQHQHWDRD